MVELVYIAPILGTRINKDLFQPCVRHFIPNSNKCLSVVRPSSVSPVFYPQLTHITPPFWLLHRFHLAEVLYLFRNNAFTGIGIWGAYAIKNSILYGVGIANSDSGEGVVPKKVQNFRNGEQEIAVPSGLHNGRFGPTQQPTTKQTRRKLLVDILIVECRLCSVVDCRFLLFCSSNGQFWSTWPKQGQTIPGVVDFGSTMEVFCPKKLDYLGWIVF